MMKINFKQFFAPEVAFEKKNKARFLAAFDMHNGTAPASKFIFVVKTLATTLAAAAIVLGGVSAYADTANVPVSSPLYPWKRIGESVQLAVATPALKPELQATFAARRATEITDLETKNPTSTLIPQLTADLNTDVDASISASSETATSTGATVAATSTASTTVVGSNATSSKDRVCDTLQKALGGNASTSIGATLLLLGHTRAFMRFETQCNGQDSAVMSSTTMPFATSTSSSTPRRFFRRIRHSSSTATGTDTLDSATTISATATLPIIINTGPSTPTGTASSDIVTATTTVTSTPIITVPATPSVPSIPSVPTVTNHLLDL